ncbi:MAG: metallophosphoesterase family protein [Thermoplasmata archaeon]|nr:metallophosphoesterase family protein [Thermoplasmata archaeon]
MRIISTADLHGKQYRLNQFLEAIEEYSPDVAVICGDITHLGPGELAKIMLDQIPIDVVAIPGNMDTKEVLEYIEKSKARNIHLKSVEIKGQKFVGIGDVGFHFDKKEIEEEVEIDEDSILVTHSPPHGVQDSVFLGMHAGSKFIRKLIEKYSPKLNLCGHIHENPGFSKLGRTVVVNCSAGRDGRGALIDIDDEIEVKML